MEKGQKAKIFCPSNIAYEDRGAGDIIPPNSDIIFEIELLDVNQDG